MSLGNNIRRLREQRGMTQEELAIKTGISRSQISNIEKGKRKTSYDRLGLIANTLGCKVSDLTDEENKERIDEDSWLLFADRMKQEGVSLNDVERWVKLAREFIGKEGK